MGYFKFWQTALSTYQKVKNQKVWVKKLLSPSADSSKKKSDGSISDYEYYKVEHYYGVGIPVVIGEGLAILRGKDMTTQERTTLTYMASITGLFDDFFDVSNYDRQKLEEMVNVPEQFEAKTQREVLFKEFTLKVLEFAPNAKKLDQSKIGVLEAQWESKKQKEEGLSFKEHKDLVKLKGGTSLSFFKDAFEDEFDQATQDAIYALGGLFQYGNDIFDVHQDTKDKKYTCVNTSKDIKTVLDDYLVEYLKVKKLFLGLTFNDQAKKAFIDHLNIVVGQCLCCLSQYKSLQEKSGGIFKPQDYTRKELVCNMEDWRNIFKTASIVAKL